ncbi:MAG: DUF1858 domain-containing protein [Clostridiales bacterium]|nr:DUF1858 domain-containing protein [Clostridiales bacterium]
MNEKIIDLNRSVHDICKEYPEIERMMVRLGFTDLKNPGMLQTAGRFMTIPKGAKMKNIDLDVIKQNIRNLGFRIKE